MVANFAQVIAAVAAGALLAMTTMLVFKLHSVQRAKAEREQTINAAADAVVGGVETFRQQIQASLPEGSGADALAVRDDTVEVRSKAHLRMLVDSRAARAAPRPRAGCDQSSADRPGRRRPSPGSRP